MAVILFNKGKRIITVGDFNLAPEKSGSFTPEVANKLKRLYGAELVCLEDQVQHFKEIGDEISKEEKSAPAAEAASEEAAPAGEPETVAEVSNETAKSEVPAPKTFGGKKKSDSGK